MGRRYEVGGGAPCRLLGLAFVASALIAAGAGCSSSTSSQGAEGQHCFPNHTCDAGLVCLSNLCVQPPDGGQGGAGGGTGGRGGSGGSTGATGGTASGGSTAGAGAAAGTTGGAAAGTTGGAAAGAGGASAGAGGSAAGAGGSAVGGGTGGASAGAGGSAGGASGTAGAGGTSAGTAGTSAGTAGAGGTSAGTAGAGGTSAGTAGASGTTGGTSAGTAGASGTTGGANAGAGGSTGGTGGTSAGAGGSNAGSGGASAGTGGASAGAGGASGGTGGTGNPITCGDGVKDPGEACDDHNRNPGDGCSALCQIEAGWQCTGVPSVCSLTAICGDGLLAVSEACDDGNTAGGDGCSADCHTIEPGYVCGVPGRRCMPACGDGMKILGEGCDDGNTASGDGCSALCQVEPGATCTGAAGGKSTCVPSACGNGAKEGNEACDCGTNPASLPAGCKGPNGLFFGDGTGCSTTCTKEPSCRSAGGATQACAASCGNGSIEAGEACDDGNTNGGDGCSPTCTVETGFTCSAAAQDDGSSCTQPGNSGTCFELPVVYRDFKNESVAGGHPDFFYLGATLATAVSETGVQGQTSPLSFSKRYCVPNSTGPAHKNDATNRCWDVAMANLDATGKPAFNSARTGGTNCDCQFIDWAHNGDGGHVPGYGDAGSAGHPLAGLTYTLGESSGGSPMYRGLAPVVTSGTTFGQWWVDSTYTGSTHTVGILELAPLGSSQYRYASQVNVVTGGFFPLDPPGQFPIYVPAGTGPGAVKTVGTEALSCNIWPYWYSSTMFGAGNNCRGDQYLFPPSLFPPDIATNCPSGQNCGGKWYTNQQGWYHDFWFTAEARTQFIYNGDFSVQFVGTDDTFIFINGVLVADLGGIHQSLPAKVSVTGSPGNANIIEGGSLNASGTAILACPSADPYTGATMNNMTNTDGNGHANCTIGTCDCRARTVNLGLQMGRTYELAIFNANRHPTTADFQLTMSGFQHSRSSCQPRCGDGVREGNEQCDCGDANAGTPTDPLCGGLHNGDTAYGGCTTACQYGPQCGDGIVNVAGGEECDAGSSANTASYGMSTGCTPGCRLPHFCGDGIVDAWAGEQCDLGVTNGMSGAPCSAACQITTP